MTDFHYLEGLFRPDVVAEIDGAPTLIGSECDECGDCQFPRAPGCPRCHAASDRLIPCALPRIGMVATCSRVERGPGGYDVPYLVGYVTLTDGAPRVLARIVARELEPSSVIGRRCVVEIGVLGKGAGGSVMGYQFRADES